MNLQHFDIPIPEDLFDEAKAAILQSGGKIIGETQKVSIDHYWRVSYEEGPTTSRAMRHILFAAALHNHPPRFGTPETKWTRALKFLKKITQRLYHKHNWAYALGISPGTISGYPRPECFRRACSTCGRKEEIEYYRAVVKVQGDEYMANPVWRESNPK